MFEPHCLRGGRVRAGRGYGEDRARPGEDGEAPAFEGLKAKTGQSDIHDYHWGGKHDLINSKQI